MDAVHTINDVFLTHPVAVARNTAAAETAQGVFVDPKTLASFPIATAVVTAISQIIVRTVSGANMAWVALAVSFAIGGLIFAITMTEEKARPHGALAWTIAVGVAIVNSLLLYAAASGVGQIMGLPANG